jgi:Fur family transcriptional regulator, ferric uptake regulator
MPAINTAQFEQTLIDNNYSVTSARKDIFKILLNRKAQTITEIIAKTTGRVDRVSVYRNIELFEKLGMVHRIHVGWKTKFELSDQFVPHHHHLSCLNCGKIIDIEDEKHIDNFIKEVADKFGFLPRHHEFEITGYCKNCQAKIK